MASSSSTTPPGLGLPPTTTRPQSLPLPNSTSPATGQVNQNGKRLLSPDPTVVASNKAFKAEEQPNGNVYRVATPESSGVNSQASSDRRPVPPMAKGTGIDLRAEEEAARRANSARFVPSTSRLNSFTDPTSLSRGKHTDLFAPNFIRERLARTARFRGHPLVVDDEAAQYLALAAEMRLRSVIGSAVRAHDHRVGSSHVRKAPLINTSVTSSIAGSSDPALASSASTLSSTIKVKQELKASEDETDGAGGPSTITSESVNAGTIAAKSGKKSKEKQGKALWNHVIRSSPAMVMAKLAELNREENKAHRVARTERNAREMEMARIAAAAAAAAAADSYGGDEGEASGGGNSGSGRMEGIANSPAASGRGMVGEREGSAPPNAGSGSIGGGFTWNGADFAHSPGGNSLKSDTGNSTGGSIGSSSTPSRPAKEISFSASPTFGSVAPRKSGGGSGSGSSKSGRKATQMSAEAQQKMTNATAMTLIGRKRYNWEVGGAGGFKPPVPSLLSGKRKKGSEGAGSGEGGIGVEDGEKVDGSGSLDHLTLTTGGGGSQNQGSVLDINQSSTNHTNNQNNNNQNIHNLRQNHHHVKPKIRPTPLPSRYNVKVDPNNSMKTVRDDAALTNVDLLFALERERGGRGAGSTDDVINRVWARWGGPWGS